MMGLPAGTRIWIAAGFTDMRIGFNGLAAKVETALADDPFICSGNQYAAEQIGVVLSSHGVRYCGHIIFRYPLSPDAGMFPGNDMKEGLPCWSFTIDIRESSSICVVVRSAEKWIALPPISRRLATREAQPGSTWLVSRD
jgi:hypothetical protein